MACNNHTFDQTLVRVLLQRGFAFVIKVHISWIENGNILGNPDLGNHVTRFFLSKRFKSEWNLMWERAWIEGATGQEMLVATGAGSSIPLPLNREMVTSVLQLQGTEFGQHLCLSLEEDLSSSCKHSLVNQRAQPSLEHNPPQLARTSDLRSVST